MINSFQSINTITSGLVLQQLEQEINASNIANPSVDSNGYLMNSLEQVNVTPGASLNLSGVGGPFQVGTGPTVESITRLRSSFLDSQIQQESTVLGQAEILANSQNTGILNQIQNIIDGPTTLSSALNTFAADWAALGSNADPATDANDQASVVQSGIAFAQLATSQFNQLETLQAGNGQQINSTITQINGLLQQLSAINKQLLATPGSNQNSLLDARDYALDKLSRLVNIQTNITANGTVSVYLSGSSVTLVDPSGAAIFQTNPLNTHYPDLVGVTIQTPEGGFYGGDVNGTPNDIENSITGGNLGGELQAQYTIMSYQEQVDQIATSVINVTNDLHEAGYAADGVTTGTPFFTGTGAASIGVNPVLITNNALVAASVSPGTPTNGQVAQFLGNLPNILADNFVESDNQIAVPGSINPATPIGAQVFASPVSATGSFRVDGVLISWNNTQSIDTILAAINGNPNLKNVYAVYNASTSQFYMFSNNPIQITNVTGNFTTWGNIANVLTSTIRMNNYEAPDMPLIDASELPPGPPFFGKPAAAPMDSTVPGSNADTGPNSIAFKVVPSTSGVFTINGNTFVWNNNMSLNQVGALINVPPATYTINGVTSPNPNPGWVGTSDIAFNFNPATQTVTLTSTQNGGNSPEPIQINDISGNFTVFTGLNADTPIGSLASGLTSQIASNTAGEQALESQASNSLNQLNIAQDNIAGVNTSSNGSGPGVPLQTIEQQAMQSLISYNAMLEVLQVIDNMYVDLVNMLGGSTATSSFAPESTSSTI